MYVMQFEVHVIVNAADVMHFMQELCSAKTHKFRGWRGDQPEQTFKHNQIAILESHILPVDREEPDHSSYEYGPDEVVDMDVICEYVFDKAAFDVEKGREAQEVKDAQGTKVLQSPQMPKTPQIPLCRRSSRTTSRRPRLRRPGDRTPRILDCG